MEINLATYMVRDAFGAPDVQETLNKFSADLDTYIAERETENEVISAAVDGVFEAHKGVRTNTPFIVSETLRALNVSAMPSAFNSLSKRVHAYLTSNSKGPDSLYVIAKGKGGGISRRADKVSATTDSK